MKVHSIHSMNRPKLPYCWDRWVKEGEMLLQRILYGVDAFFDESSKIKHFDIGLCNKKLSKNLEATVVLEQIKQLHAVKSVEANDLERELCVWIKEQLRNADLLLSRNWRPFANPEYAAFMFLGYRILFPWKKYYFQLMLESDCVKEQCEYCKKEGSAVHFRLGLYGWKDEGHVLLQPLNEFDIQSGNLISNNVWFRVEC